MKKVAISVTEAARNFSECVNQARYRNVTFVFLKNGLPVARLTAENLDKICTGRDLAEILAEHDLPAGEAKEWRRDWLAARKALKDPSNKWR